MRPRTGGNISDAVAEAGSQRNGPATTRDPTLTATRPFRHHTALDAYTVTEPHMVLDVESRTTMWAPTG